MTCINKEIGALQADDLKRLYDQLIHQGNDSDSNQKNKNKNDQNQDSLNLVDYYAENTSLNFFNGKKTLIKNYDDLKTNKIESELSYDPLFIKMSSKFEETGAGGLLMSTLP